MHKNTLIKCTFTQQTGKEALSVWSPEWMYCWHEHGPDRRCRGLDSWEISCYIWVLGIHFIGDNLEKTAVGKEVFLQVGILSWTFPQTQSTVPRLLTWTWACDNQQWSCSTLCSTCATKNSVFTLTIKGLQNVWILFCFCGMHPLVLYS